MSPEGPITQRLPGATKQPSPADWRIPEALSVLRHALIGAVVLLQLLGSSVYAESGAGASAPGGGSSLSLQSGIPENLRPWISWVAEREPDWACAALNEKPECSWPASLRISVSQAGAEFSLEGTQDRLGPVPLPGGEGLWPIEVKNGDGSSAVVLEKGGRLAAVLPAGKFHLSGVFSWSEMPKSLQLPPETGLLSFSLFGSLVEQPLVSDSGELWFKKAEADEQAVEDSVTVQVFRKLEDGVPFRISTSLMLRVAGRVRELTLGDILPPSSTLTEVESPLEVRIAQGGIVKLQARPGEHRILFQSLLAAPPATLEPKFGALSGWPAEEVWVWAPEETFRSVSLAGGTLVDASRTELPDDWKGLTTYLVKAGESLKFSETRRGELEQGSNALSLDRTVWLPLTGGDLLVRDSISGQMSRDWRLNASPELELGRVSIGGKDQLITEDPKNHARGVELRSQAVNITAESRLAAKPSDLPVIAWDHPMEKARLTLRLPPGWEILHASGADEVSETWLASWSLLDVFLVLLAAVATYHLIGKLAGALVLAALLLLHQQFGSPQMIYFHLLGGYALLKVLPEGSFQRFVRFHFSSTLLLFGVLVATFSFHHLVQALFPSVLPPGSNLYGFLEPFFFLIEGTFGGWVMLTLFVWGALQFLRGFFLEGLFYGAGAILLMMVVGATESFTGAYPGTSPQYQMQSSGGATFYNDARIAESILSDSLGSGERGRKNLPLAKAPKVRFEEQSLNTIDPKAVVQTGPGLPSWDWKSVSMSWSGKVEAGYRVAVWLISPLENAVLSFARVGLLVWLLLLFIGKTKENWLSRLRVSGSALALLLTLGGLLASGLSSKSLYQESLFSSVAWAEAPAGNQGAFPHPELLQELHERLLHLRCEKDCVSISRMSLEVSGTMLSGEFSVSASGAQAAAFPGPMSQLAISSVVMDGAPLSAMRRDENGNLWGRIPDGVHKITFSGRLRGGEVATLQFPSNPLHLAVRAAGWEVDGISPTGSVDGSVQLSRSLKNAENGKEASSESELELSSWVNIERSLALGLPWQVTTTIRRQGSLDRPELVKVRLLEGESVVSDGIKVESGFAQALFQRGSDEVSWQGSLTPTSQIHLQSSQDARTSETWELRCGSVRECRVSGISPEHSVMNGESAYLWRPFPGEEAAISVERPSGASGQSVTIDNLRYSLTPGVRSMEALMEFNFRASQGASQRIELPKDATLTKVSIDGRDETTRYQGTGLSIPVKPGAMGAQVGFSVPREAGLQLRAPHVELPGRAANVTVSMTVPADRWIILAQGPGFGPAVLFWGKLLAVILFAILLGRAGLGPVGTGSWLLFGLGLATLPVPLMLVPVLWFWALKRRKENPIETRFRFNLMQLGLAVLTLVVLMLCYRAVEIGLIMSPDMMVRGNGSSSYALTWYVDYAEQVLPQPVLVSFPIWVWRILMLVWSTWLVFSLLGWLRWAYSCVSSDGWWKSKAAA